VGKLTEYRDGSYSMSTVHSVFTHPESLRDIPFHYCPGCGHSIAHRLIAETIDRLGIRERTIGIAPVGCAVFAHRYFAFDMLEVAHGRPPASASAMKRLLPDRVVFSYQGDGDLAAIGTAEIIHAANRGENITVFFINNATYGMTGGQMAPTTLCSQRTATTNRGRRPAYHGNPLNVAELINATAGCSFIARGALNTVPNILRSGAYIEKALRVQMETGGFSFVELLSPCPTAWGKTPEESLDWMKSEMITAFPLGVLKEIHGV